MPFANEVNPRSVKCIFSPAFSWLKLHLKMSFQHIPPHNADYNCRIVETNKNKNIPNIAKN